MLLLGTSQTTGYLDTGVSPGEMRHYAVRATNGTVSGDFSDADETFVEVPLPAPRSSPRPMRAKATTRSVSRPPVSRGR